MKATRLFRSVCPVFPLAGLAAALLAAPILTGCAPDTDSGRVRVESRLFDAVEIIASRGVAPGQVNKPRSVAVDHEDNLFVLDFTGRVQKFSENGDFLLFWQMPETERGNPKGLSVTPDGNIIVVEPHYSRVNLFTTNGDLLMQWGVHGTNQGEFSFPRAAVVSAGGEWFVSEFGVVDRIQKFAFETQTKGGNPQLRFIAAYGRAGDGPGEFNRAEGLCIDGEDRLLVADAVNHRIQILTTNGSVVGGYGCVGNGTGELGYPYDVCTDAQGLTYVCEFGNSRIQVFDANGQSIEILGGPGTAPGMFNNPWGVALDSHGNLFVADSRNHRVQKFLRSPRANVQVTAEVSQRRRDGTRPPSPIVNPKS